MYDIAIIGAGPAGATLARLLGKSFKILIIDKRDLKSTATPSRFEKTCGGLLAPDAQEMLARFGLGLPEHVLTGPQLFAVRAIDIPEGIERFYQRHYINVSREKFDQWLVSIIPESVEIRYNSYFKFFKQEDNLYKITYRYQDKLYTDKAKILVGAEGALSRLRKITCPDCNNINTYISIQEYFEGEPQNPFFSAIFDEEVTDFYSWTIPKGEHLLLGTAIPVCSKAYDKFELLKKKLKRYNFNFNNCIKREGAYILRPKNTAQIFTGKDNIALIGEAAGFISPSSAEGFSYAFSSAASLAEAIHKCFDNFLPLYNSELDSLITNIMIKNLKSPFMYNPLLRKIIMKSGFNAIKINILQD
jgi:flavin-dependent dehydrogenase